VPVFYVRFNSDEYDGQRTVLNDRVSAVARRLNELFTMDVTSCYIWSDVGLCTWGKSEEMSIGLTFEIIDGVLVQTQCPLAVGLQSPAVGLQSLAVGYRAVRPHAVGYRAVRPHAVGIAPHHLYEL